MPTDRGYYPTPPERAKPILTQRMRCGKDHRKLYRIPADAKLSSPMDDPQWVTGADGEPIRCTEPGCAGSSGKPRAMRVFTILGKHSDKIKCGARCVSSTGEVCECSCSGLNHGGN